MILRIWLRKVEIMNEDFYNVLRNNMTFANKAAKSGDKKNNDIYTSFIYDFLKNFKAPICLDFFVKIRKLDNGTTYFIKIQTDEMIITPERTVG